MKLLDGLRVLAWKNAADGALAQFLADLGARVTRCESALRETDVASADMLIDTLGLPRIADTGMSRSQLEAANPGLIHVSVSTFGSQGPPKRFGATLTACKSQSSWPAATDSKLLRCSKT